MNIVIIAAVLASVVLPFAGCAAIRLLRETPRPTMARVLRDFMAATSYPSD